MNDDFKTLHQDILMYYSSTYRWHLTIQHHIPINKRYTEDIYTLSKPTKASKVKHIPRKRPIVLACSLCCWRWTSRPCRG